LLSFVSVVVGGKTLLGEKSNSAVHDGGEIFLRPFLENGNIEETVPAAFEREQLANVACFFASGD